MATQKKLRDSRSLVKRLKKTIAYETGRVRPIDPGDPSYPNAKDVATCLRNAPDGLDLVTEARFVLWQDERIKELERQLRKKEK